ncbi:helix-turn-helix domain-containing protein [Anaeromassilibacillus senegalensis]|uniref:helix-turn-helix domain-containing protein n=1 Tax=Anaeromassilibacillus senegalensis TaxID=1673717 RepID=UPI0009E21DE9|nr:helix-turn-helix transcriptional regulator [Anaeromassilibacillus senegalensis]
MKYDKIKILRVDNDKTQQELADFLNLTRSAYSNYENNIREIPIEVLSGIADFWNTSVDYLLDRTDEKKPYPRKEK